MEITMIGTKNFKIEKKEKFNFEKYKDEEIFYIVNNDDGGATYVTRQSIQELIDLLEYLKTVK